MSFWRRAIQSITTRFWNLGLIWKLLIPLVAMTVSVGLLGTFFTVRHLTDQAEIDLEQDLFRRSAAAQAAVRDLRLELADAVNFGANILGVPDAVARRDAPAAQELLASVAAVHGGVDVLVFAGIDGVGIVEAVRDARGLQIGAGTDWDAPTIGEDVLSRAGPTAPLRTGFVRVSGAWVLATGGPVILDGQVVGTLIVGVGADAVTELARERAAAPVEIFNRARTLVASSDAQVSETEPPAVSGGGFVRRIGEVDGRRTATLYGLLDLGSQAVGTLAVRVPTGPAFDAVEGATTRLSLVVILAMAGIVALGIAFTQVILRQVRPLVAANERLGRGDLTARAPVRGRDELGELAMGLNLMAEQLEAAQSELEMRVAARTEELERLYRDGAKIEQGRADLFAEIAHEFRNHLFAVAGFAELMQLPTGPPTDPGWEREYGSVIGQAVGQMRNRVDQLLDLAETEAPEASFEFQEVSLDEFIGELRGTMVALARRGEIELVVTLADDLPVLRADRRRLEQVVMNLVSNAVKYTPPGGRIGLDLRGEGDRIVLEVEDTGVGIPEGAGDHIFEPFYRASGTVAHRGMASSGLGLALTKRLVEGHRGTIEYRSVTGAGSTFTVKLPVTRKPSRSPGATRGNGAVAVSRRGSPARGARD